MLPLSAGDVMTLDPFRQQEFARRQRTAVAVRARVGNARALPSAHHAYGVMKAVDRVEALMVYMEFTPHVIQSATTSRSKADHGRLEAQMAHSLDQKTAQLIDALSWLALPEGAESERLRASLHASARLLFKHHGSGHLDHAQHHAQSALRLGEEVLECQLDQATHGGDRHS